MTILKFGESFDLLEGRVYHRDTVPTWRHDFDVTEEVTLWIDLSVIDYHKRGSYTRAMVVLNCDNRC